MKPQKTMSFTDEMKPQPPEGTGLPIQGLNMPYPLKPKYIVGDIVQVEGTSDVIEITAVRAERVQDITAGDTLSEGIDLPEIINATTPIPRPDEYETWNEERKEEWCTAAARKMYFAQCHDIDNHFKAFEELWNSIYGDTIYSWVNNPWVWVYTYKMIEVTE